LKDAEVLSFKKEKTEEKFLTAHSNTAAHSEGMRIAKNERFDDCILKRMRND